MRVLLLSQFYPPVIGGEERHVRNLGMALAARGHRVSVATQAGQEDVGFTMDGELRVHRLRGTLQRIGVLFSDTERPHAPPMPDPELVLGLKRVIAQERPDVVHAHNWLLHSFLPLKSLSNAPLIVTLHDYSFACARKDFMHRGLNRCSGPAPRKCLGCASEHYGGIKGRVTTLANWASAARERRVVDKFLAVSGAVARLNGLQDTGVAFEVIPNFVPDEISHLSTEVDANLLSTLPEQFILFVGDLHPLKGGNLLIEAYGKLPSAPPLVLIGRRFPGTAVTLPPRVRILDPWPHAAIMHAWSRCLFGAAPSLLNEACATVVLEAMAQGKPMVVTDVGGMPEIVADAETGLVVKPDAASLAAGLARMLHEPDSRRRMGEAARVRVGAFKASAVVSRVEGVYHTLLARRIRTAQSAPSHDVAQ